MAAALSKLKNWFNRKSRSSRLPSLEPPPELLARFLEYKKLLAANSAILAIVADLKDRVNGGSPIDVQYVRQACGRLDRKAETLVATLLAMSGGRYTGLEAARRQVAQRLADDLAVGILLTPGPLALPLMEVREGMFFGDKAEKLGELTRQGFKVPAGFGVSAYAQKLFFEAADLETYIRRAISQSHIRDLESLREAGEDIRARIRAQELPEELAQAISSLLAGLPSDRVAVRSSPLEEDGQFSFAGQFDTILNVTAVQALERYKEVIASQFTPRSLYYCHTSGFSCQELAMGVVVMEMVAAATAGVLYTDDPGRAGQQYPRGLRPGVPGGGGSSGAGHLHGGGRPAGGHPSRGKDPDARACSPGGPPGPGGPGGAPGAMPGGGSGPGLDCPGPRVRQHFHLPQEIEWALGADENIYLLQARPLREVCYLRTGGEAVPQSGLPGAGAVLEADHASNPLDHRGEDFRPEACRTYHDITRFAHEKAKEEMFQMAADTGGGGRPPPREPSASGVVPHRPGGRPEPCRRRPVAGGPEHLRSRPLLAYWKGVSEAGRQGPEPADLAGFLSGRTGAATGTDVQENPGEKNFAIITDDYLILSNRLGFDFAALESFLGIRGE